MKEYDLERFCNTQFLKDLLKSHAHHSTDEILKMLQEQHIQITYPKLKYAMKKFGTKPQQACMKKSAR